METISERSFSLNIRVMLFLRMYYSEHHTLIFKIEACLICAVLLVTFPILAMMYVFREGVSMEQINNDAMSAMAVAYFTLKFLVVYGKTARLRRLIHYFDSSHFSKIEEVIIEEYCKYCRRMTQTFMIAFLMGFFVSTLRPIFNRKQMFIVNIWLPKKVIQHPTLFFCAYIYVFVVSTYLLLASAFVDCLVGGLVQIAVGHVQVLKDSLRHISEYVSDVERNVGRKTILDAFLKKYAQNHIAILKFGNEFQECFSMYIFSQCFGGCFFIGIGCFHISKVPLTSFESMTTMLYLAIVFAQTYFYCYFGTLLYEETNSLQDAVYMSPWYEYDPDTKKQISIILECSKKPVIVTAGKTVDVTIGTFVRILRASYSLLSVLRNF